MSLSIDDLKELQERLFGVSNKWYDIGLQLLLSANDLDSIEANSNSTQHCLREMLKRWLRRVNPHPTWKAVVDALKSVVVGEQWLAQQLEEALYCKQDKTRSLSSAQPGGYIWTIVW